MSTDSCAAAPGAAAPSVLPAGTRLGEFELRQVPGVGGFGIVHLVFDHDLEREVAVKEYMPASALANPPQVLQPAVAGPKARCAGRNPIFNFTCMERECGRSESTAHPACRNWRKEAPRREQGATAPPAT